MQNPVFHNLPTPPDLARPQPMVLPYGYTNGQFYGGFGQSGPAVMYPPPGALLIHGGVMPVPRAPPPPPQTVQTQTIKNRVNFKKNSVTLTPLEGAPGLHALSFRFDATAPCRASVFVQAQEDPANAFALRPLQGSPRPAVSYEKGMDLAYPSPAAAASAAGGAPAEAAAAHVVDARAAGAAAALTQQAGNVYPLVVRLECVSDEGRAQARCVRFVCMLTGPNITARAVVGCRSAMGGGQHLSCCNCRSTAFCSFWHPPDSYALYCAQ